MSETRSFFNIYFFFEDLGPHEPVLQGRTRFGDNIEDEWFIVFLLRNITREYPFLIASVIDNDGQFLLIESAAQLPDWVDPSNSTHRVFIRAGRLHFIPLANHRDESDNLCRLSPAFRSARLTLQKALTLVQSFPTQTLAPVDIENAAFSRCNINSMFDDGKTPKVHGQVLHKARCILPRDIARALHTDRRLVAPAVEAFYYRDAEQVGCSWFG